MQELGIVPVFPIGEQNWIHHAVTQLVDILNLISPITVLGVDEQVHFKGWGVADKDGGNFALACREVVTLQIPHDVVFEEEFCRSQPGVGGHFLGD